MNLAETIEKMIDAKLSKAAKGPSTVPAEFVGTDGEGRPWVMLPGAEEATPVSRMSVEAAPGDTVAVTVGNLRATVDSNISNPSAGVQGVREASAKASDARTRASSAQKSASAASEKAGRAAAVANAASESAASAAGSAELAVAEAGAAGEKADAAALSARAASRAADAARQAAEEADSVARATNQHFWHRAEDPGDGAGSGAFVTDTGRDEFLDAAGRSFPDWQPDGSEAGFKPYFNLIENSEGIVLRSALRRISAFTHSAVAFFDGLGNGAANIVARFGADGAQIGKDSSNHVTIDADGMSIVGPSGSYANVNGVDVLAAASTADAAKSAIDGLEIGGRNLLLGTGAPASGTITSDANAQINPYNMVAKYSELGLAVGDPVTVSFDYSYTGAPEGGTVKVGTNAAPWEYFGTLLTTVAGSGSGHVSKTFRATSALVSSAGSNLRLRTDNASGMTFTISHAKLETGSRESAWTPAPEDTSNHFWADSGGVHVSTQAATAAGTYNSLFTSTGLLFRKGANNLASLTASALNFYDGNGNAASSVTASFGADSMRIGKTGSGNRNVLVDADGFHVRDNATDTAYLGPSAATIGKVANNHLFLNADVLSFNQANGNDTAITGAKSTLFVDGANAKIRIGKHASPHFLVDSTSMGFYPASDNTASNAMFYADASSVRIGKDMKQKGNGTPCVELTSTAFDVWGTYEGVCQKMVSIGYHSIDSATSGINVRAGGVKSPHGLFNYLDAIHAAYIGDAELYTVDDSKKYLYITQGSGDFTDEGGEGVEIAGGVYIDLNVDAISRVNAFLTPDGFRAIRASDVTSGTFPVARGGTGATTDKAARNSLLGGMNDLTSTNDVTDSTMLVAAYVSPTASNGAIYKYKAQKFWDYFKGKSDAVYLPLSGGTLAGALSIKHSVIDLDEPDNGSSVTTNYRSVYMKDKDGDNFAVFEGAAGPNGDTAAIAMGRNKKADGTFAVNQLRLGVNKDGTNVVSVTDPAAWQNAVVTKTAKTNLPLNSAAKAYSGRTPFYCRFGKVVQVCGAVSPASEVAAGGSLTIGTLPSGCRPQQQTDVLCQGSGNAVWLLTVSTDGVMTASRYRSGASANAAIPTTAWLTFNATFIVA